MLSGGEITANECEQRGGEVVGSLLGWRCLPGGDLIALNPLDEYKVCQRFEVQVPGSYSVSADGKKTVPGTNVPENRSFCTNGKTFSEALQKLENGKSRLQSEVNAKPDQRFSRWLDGRWDKWFEVKSGNSIGEGHSPEQAKEVLAQRTRNQ